MEHKEKTKIPYDKKVLLEHELDTTIRYSRMLSGFHDKMCEAFNEHSQEAKNIILLIEQANTKIERIENYLLFS